MRPLGTIGIFVFALVAGWLGRSWVLAQEPWLGPVSLLLLLVPTTFTIVGLTHAHFRAAKAAKEARAGKAAHPTPPDPAPDPEPEPDPLAERDQSQNIVNRDIIRLFDEAGLFPVWILLCFGLGLVLRLILTLADLTKAWGF